MKSVLATTTLLVALCGAASAADTVAEAAPAYSWSGIYLGGQIGQLWGDGRFSIDALGGTSANGAVEGRLGGFYGGANYQFDNNVVLGIDADFTWHGAADFVQYTAPGGVPLPPGSGVHYNLMSTSAFRLKAGYAMGPFLPYVAGGLAYGSVDVNAVFATSVAAADKVDMSGWTLGAGVDYAVTDNIIGRIEYRHTDLGEFDLWAGSQHGRGSATGNEMRVGLALKF